MTPESRCLPDYASRFRCIGPACEDSCCVGWQITIDRATFTKYRGMRQSPLSRLLDERIVANQESTSDRDFAQVQLDASCVCPFLSPQRLCTIQTEHGAEALSSTCAEYPRLTRRIDGRQETSLTISCPEAARLILLDRSYNSRSDADLRDLYLQFADSTAQLASASGNPYQYFWAVRAFTFLLLRDRSYPLWQRLFVLGKLLRRLSAPGRGGRAVPELLATYAVMMADGKLREALEQIPARLEAQLSVWTGLLAALNRQRALPDRFLKCASDCFKGLGCLEGSAPSVEAYQQAYTRYFAPFFARREYLFENYLLSYVVRKRFPYGDDRQSEASEGPLMEFTMMALRFAVIKGVMIGMAGHYKKVNARQFVQLVQSFEKRVEHSGAARAAMAECIHAANLDSPEGIAMMLRN